MVSGRIAGSHKLAQYTPRVCTMVDTCSSAAAELPLPGARSVAAGEGRGQHLRIQRVHNASLLKMGEGKAYVEFKVRVAHTCIFFYSLSQWCEAVMREHTPHESANDGQPNSSRTYN